MLRILDNVSRTLKEPLVVFMLFLMTFYNYSFVAQANFTEVQRIDGDGGSYGYSFDLSEDGNRAIVGAYQKDSPTFREGEAYIYTKSGSTWSFEQTLTASDPELDDSFGVSVSLDNDGNVAIVGASSQFGTGEAGSAYVFRRSGTTWTEEEIFEAGQAEDAFGFEVDVTPTGDYVLVGAGDYATDSVTDGAGAVFAYSYTGSSWVFHDTITDSSPSEDNYLGQAVRISSDGQTMVAGSYGATVGGQNNAGAITIFTRSGSDWNFTEKLIASDFVAGQNFGISVDIDTSDATDRLLIGAPGFSGDPGAVYYFENTGSGYNEVQKISASDGSNNNEFGYLKMNAAGNGDVLAIGAPSDDNGNGLNAGAIYVYERNGSTWGFSQKILPLDGQASDFFGYYPALTNDGTYLGAGTFANSAYFFQFINPADIPEYDTWLLLTVFILGFGVIYRKKDFAFSQAS